MTGPVRRLILLAVIGALLVGLVAGGLALLDWQPIGLAREIRLANLSPASVSPAHCGCSPLSRTSGAVCRQRPSGWSSASRWRCGC